MSSPSSLPEAIRWSAQQGELQKVVKWLCKGGVADALCPSETVDGRPPGSGLLHAAATYGQLEMVDA